MPERPSNERNLESTNFVVKVEPPILSGGTDVSSASTAAVSMAARLLRLAMLRRPASLGRLLDFPFTDRDSPTSICSMGP